MYSFKNDYSEGCHPSILKRLAETNPTQQNGYGDDEYSVQARALIRSKINQPDAEVYFVSGGTQANLTIISACLRPHESVIAAHSGHIATHEAGAIEAVGHKINIIQSIDGKIKIEDIANILEEHQTVPHMVKPKMVYISQSTEVGSVYTKSELERLSSFCKAHGLYLFLDGARIGSALCADGVDMTLQDVARLTDVFYIGGTKNGALLGEAIVIVNDTLKHEFAFFMKQRGALLAKGRILGIQFFELFSNDLFFTLAKHANQMARKLSQEMKEVGYTFLSESVTNQIFPIVPHTLIEKLEKEYEFYVWQKIDTEHSAIRLVTSWATEEHAVEDFLKLVRTQGS